MTTEHDAVTAGLDAIGPVTDDTSVYVEGLPLDAAPPPRRGVSLVTSGLVAALIAALAFFGGVRLEKSRAKATSANTALAAFAAARAGRFTGNGGGTGTARSAATGGGAGGGFGGGAATFGQVRLVDGTTIYVGDAQGGITKVTTGPGATFTKTSSGTIADIHPGDTVVVQGQPQADGTVAATRVVDNGAGGGGRGG
jgi:hypothetical protein